MVLKTEKLSSIRVMVIAEAEQQRLAFRDTISTIGMSLVECLAPHELQERHLSIEADIWLVDSQYNDELYNKLDNLLISEPTSPENSKSIDASTQVTDKSIFDKRLMLVGFELAPELDEINLYAKWQRKLKRKLASMLNLPTLSARKGKANKFKPWRYVVYLAGGANDVPAIKAFLDELPNSLPITILVALQVDKASLHSLPSLLSQDNEWRYQVISLSLNMQAGNCYIAPLFQKVVCDSTGRAIVYQGIENMDDVLSISELLENCSEAFGDQLISVLFSDVDTKTYSDLNIARLKDNNSQIWQQISSNSQVYNTISEQYRKEIFTAANAQCSGDSSELAHKLIDYVSLS